MALGSSAGWLLSKLLRLRHHLITAGGGTPHGHPPSAAGSHLHPPGGRIARLLRHPAAARLRPVLPLLVSAAAFAAAEELGAEPLLTCVAAGMVASNWRQDQQQGRDAAELLSADLIRLAPLVNALFFGLVGASLKLKGGRVGWVGGGGAGGVDCPWLHDCLPTHWPAALLPTAVRDSLWAAAILYAVRLAGVWLGCWLGGGAGGTSHDVGRRMWMAMVTQASRVVREGAVRCVCNPGHD